MISNDWSFFWPTYNWFCFHSCNEFYFTMSDFDNTTSINHLFCLTQSRFLRQTYRPRSKWPTVNFFGLNQQALFVDRFGNFFPKSFRGKGVIFALKVWAIPTKNHKNKALMRNWTHSPKWEAGVHTTTPMVLYWTRRCILMNWCMKSDDWCTINIQIP